MTFPRRAARPFPPRPSPLLWHRSILSSFLLALGTPLAFAQETAVAPGQAYPALPDGQPDAVKVENAEASDADSMKPYAELIQGPGLTFDMVPIPGGTFVMGSPDDEADRNESEGPQVEIEVSPFWMSAHEVRWDEYHVFMFKLDIQRRANQPEPFAQDQYADAVSRPTPPYQPMDFEMGVDGYPAICMTQFAAKQYTQWLSMKTGRFYRLPTEAEWEYACRAGTKTAYSFGDDAEQLDDYGWYFDNADDQYQPVGQKKPNAWGLYDMHGNVWEWVLDRFDPGTYATLREKGKVVDPIFWPETLYPRTVRGGSWDDDPHRLRSAARRGSSENWKVQDPQLPKSIWYHTDATWVGIRLVRPLEEPTLEEKKKFWDPDLEAITEIYEKQRQGGR